MKKKKIILFLLIQPSQKCIFLLQQVLFQHRPVSDKTMFVSGDYFNYLRKIYLHDGEVKGERIPV